MGRRGFVMQQTIIEGDCLQVLPTLPAGSVHAAMCSPPYYGLRAYGLGQGELGHEARHDCTGWVTGIRCGDCYTCRLVGIFAQVRRVLRDDGTLWVVISDSLANKQLLGVPWRLALALQADGWVLRSSIIWAKPNPMPESVRDRCTRSHEQVFMMAKQPRYYFDYHAIQEKTVYCGTDGVSKNKRDVWTCHTQPFSARKLGLTDVDHFAAYPEALVEPMIRAATSEAGVCAACGAPWRRIVERGESSWKTRLAAGHPTRYGDASAGQHQGRSTPVPKGRREGGLGWVAHAHTIGWQAACACKGDTAPATVLDPFLGSGTTLCTARRLGRAGIGIEQNPDYVRIAQARLAQIQERT